MRALPEEKILNAIAMLWHGRSTRAMFKNVGCLSIYMLEDS